MGALTNQQIITLCVQAAKCPGYTAQAGQIYNTILEELCLNYNLDVTKKFFTFNFNPSLATVVGNAAIGSGPYPLPADFLRCVDEKSVYWTLLGVPYPMIPIDLAEFDMSVQQAGLNAYPYWFCTDVSLNDAATEGLSVPYAYVYPPPSGAYPVFVRYFSLMAPIATPETSTAYPWFPDTAYLRTRLTGELLAITDDDRADDFLGDGPRGAQTLIKRYLPMKDDHQNRSTNVSLDRRRFSGDFNKLRNTKTIGW